MRKDSLQEFVKLRRQLTEEKATIEKRLNQINEALGDLTLSRAPSPSTSAPAKASRGKRQMSAEARARIGEAQRRRWATRREGSKGSNQTSDSQKSAKRKMSPAGRRAISDAAKRRWAAARAAGKSRL